MLEPKDVITFSVSGLSLFIAATALYLGQFRRPKYAIKVGPEVHLFYGLNSTSGLYLPVIFQNTSPVRGLVDRAYLVIRTPADGYFTLRWIESVSIKWPEVEYQFVDRAKPFTLDGFGSRADVFLFIAPRRAGEPHLDFVEGTYELTLKLWALGGRRPVAIKSAKLDLRKEGAEILKSHLENGVNKTRYFSLQESPPVSFHSASSPPGHSQMRR